MWKLSRVQLFVTPWTVAFQAPLSMEFSRHKYCSGLPFPFIWFPFHIKRNMSFSLFLSFLSWKLLCILVLRVNELPPGFLLAGPSRWLSGKDPPRDQCSILGLGRGNEKKPNPWVGKRKWQPALGFLPGKFHGQRSFMCYSSRGCKELDTTEWLSTQHSLMWRLPYSFPLSLVFTSCVSYLSFGVIFYLFDI